MIGLGDSAVSGDIGVLPGIGVDFSLSLINKTGAYYISNDLVENLRPLLSGVQYWRFQLRSNPAGIARKLLARLMLGEYRLLQDWPHFTIQRRAAKVLYLDPLYVLRSQLDTSDIVLCHDVGPLTHQALFDPATVELYRRAYEKIRRVGPGVVFVSEASRQAFIGLFGSSFRYQRVITLYPRRELQHTEPRKITSIDRPFILAVGGIEQRKNYVRCMEAFSRSAARNSHLLVICGPRGNAADAVAEASRSHAQVRVLGRVSDGALSWLYQNAAGFLLPSLLEGFGVPVIEAAERNLVCVTSAGGAQEEALGGHGIFVDPTQTEDVVSGIDRLLSMSAKDKADCIAKAKAHTATLTRERFISAWSELLTQELATMEVAHSSRHSLEAQSS